MQINPYDPPSRDAAVSDTLSADLPPTRPVGITLLAILNGIGSIAIAVFFLVVANFGDNEEWFATKGLTLTTFLLIGGFAATLGLASSVGLWTGTKWAWWLLAWYYVFTVFGSTLGLIPTVARLRSPVQEELIVELLRSGIRIVFHAALAFYFFRTNVLRFFQFDPMKKWPLPWIHRAHMLVSA